MEKVSAIGGMARSLGNVHVTTKDRQWIPSASDASKGSWRQETEHASTFVLTCPPAFNWPSLNIAVRLDIPNPRNMLSICPSNSTACLFTYSSEDGTPP